MERLITRRRTHDRDNRDFGHFDHPVRHLEPNHECRTQHVATSPTKTRPSATRCDSWLLREKSRRGQRRLDFLTREPRDFAPGGFKWSGWNPNLRLASYEPRLTSRDPAFRKALFLLRPTER